MAGPVMGGPRAAHALALALLLAGLVPAAVAQGTVSAKETPGVLVPPSATPPGGDPQRITGPAQGQTTVILGSHGRQGVVEFGSPAEGAGIQLGAEPRSGADSARDTAAANLADGRVDGDNEDRVRARSPVETTVKVKDVVTSTKTKSGKACVSIGVVESKATCPEKRP